MKSVLRKWAPTGSLFSGQKEPMDNVSDDLVETGETWNNELISLPSGLSTPTIPSTSDDQQTSTYSPITPEKIQESVQALIDETSSILQPLQAPLHPDPIATPATRLQVGGITLVVLGFLRCKGHLAFTAEDWNHMRNLASLMNDNGSLISIVIATLQNLPFIMEYRIVCILRNRTTSWSGRATCNLLSRYTPRCSHVSPISRFLSQACQCNGNLLSSTQ